MFFASIVEKVLIRLLTGQQLRIMKRVGADRRGQHPKHQGCLWAEFTIDGNLPHDMLIGLFAKPRRYDCIIRFSNGSSEDDRESDAHGMAIKLLSVPGEKLLEDEKHEETMDFVLADHPVFFARNVWHLIQFAWAQSRGKSPVELAQSHPAVNGFKKQAQASPLASEYWSQTPYRMGNTAVRYSVKPRPGNASGAGDRTSANFLREALVEHLTEKQQGASFDFYVQQAPDSGKKWENDPTLVWDQSPPPVQVASLTIPPQQFNTPQQQAFCEQLSYTPWHCLPDHQPLGQINRARRVVYRASSRLRHRTTGATVREPTIADRP